MLLTKKELAAELNVAVSTINNKMKKGMPYVKIGKSVRFELNDVIKYLKEI